MQDSGIDSVHVNYDTHSFFRASLVAQMVNSLPAMQTLYFSCEFLSEDENNFLLASKLISNSNYVSHAFKYNFGLKIYPY